MLTADEARSRYWKGLLMIWFICSLGCGVLWVDLLDQFMLPGTGIKLGFWFAQQGSILVFLVLLAAFVFIMNKLDKELTEAIEATRKESL